MQWCRLELLRAFVARAAVLKPPTVNVYADAACVHGCLGGGCRCRSSSCGGFDCAGHGLCMCVRLYLLVARARACVLFGTPACPHSAAGVRVCMCRAYWLLPGTRRFVGVLFTHAVVWYAVVSGIFRSLWSILVQSCVTKNERCSFGLPHSPRIPLQNVMCRSISVQIRRETPGTPGSAPPPKTLRCLIIVCVCEQCEGGRYGFRAAVAHGSTCEGLDCSAKGPENGSVTESRHTDQRHLHAAYRGPCPAAYFMGPKLSGTVAACAQRVFTDVLHDLLSE